MQKHRNDIDGLRALAVLAVVVNHFSAAWLPGGYLGVDIFFVISGFVITRSMQGEPQPLGGFLAGFYARRIRRIWPALLVCVAVTALLTAFFNPSPRIAINTGASSLFGLSNLYLFRQASDYFSDSTRLNSFTHTWSLGVEEQFYFLYPILAWALLFGNRPARSRSFFLVVGGLSLASLLAFIVMQPRSPIAVFYLLPFRFWELGLGCLLARMATPGGRTTGAALAVAGLAICLALPEALILPATVAAVLATGALLYVGGSGVWSDRLLGAPVMRFFGNISYSLYLWHWPILAISRWTIGIHWWSVPFQFALMLACATLSYRYIETPWRKSPAGEKPTRAIGVGVGLSGAVAAGLFILSTPFDGALFLGRRAPLAERGAASLAHDVSLPGLGRWEGGHCLLMRNEDAGKAIDPARCTLGNPAAPRRLLVIGNSYASSFVAGFKPLVERGDVAVTLVSSLGASPTPSIPNTTPWSGANTALWTRIYPQLAGNLRSGDVVMLLSRLVELVPDPETASAAADRARLARDLQDMSARLAQRGIKLIFVDSLPFVSDAVCAPDAAYRQWYAPLGGPCNFRSRAYHLNRRAPLSDMLVDLDRRGVITRIDLFDLFCPGSVCNFEAPGVPTLYRDEYAHPSLEAMPLAGERLTRELQGVLQPR